MSTRVLLITAVLTGLSVLAVFVVPHHAYPEHTYKARTLWEIVRPVFSGELPRGVGPLAVLCALVVLGAFAAVYPVALVPLVQSSLVVDQATGAAPMLHRSWFVAGGVVALVGSAVNVLVILVSEMSFGFGASSSSANRTFGFVAIPAFQAGVALVSVVIGALPVGARMAFQIMSP
jgi:hypothetical protein